MTRMAVGIVLGIVLTALGAAAQDGFALNGRVGATDQEAQEGYFALDDETMLVVKPGSRLHDYLRSRVGQRMTLTLGPQPES